jgi:uncharacterized protein (TIGR00730 family)
MAKRSRSSGVDSNPGPERPTADGKLFQLPSFVERRAFVDTDPWRALRILGEFVEGFDELADVTAAVTFFGSARMLPEDPMYQLTVETARRLGEHNFAIITGAGGGVMEAANRGAHEVGALSIGLNIELPHEQAVNPYVDREVHFRYMFARKTMLVKYSSAFLFPPGGFGTLDELCEVLTLKQTEKIRDIPIVLMGRDYWLGFLNWIDGVVRAEGKISPEDLDLFHVTDDPDEAVKIVLDGWSKRVGESDTSPSRLPKADK